MSSPLLPLVGYNSDSSSHSCDDEQSDHLSSHGSIKRPLTSSPRDVSPCKRHKYTSISRTPVIFHIPQPLPDSTTPSSPTIPTSTTSSSSGLFAFLPKPLHNRTSTSTAKSSPLPNKAPPLPPISDSPTSSPSTTTTFTITTKSIPPSSYLSASSLFSFDDISMDNPVLGPDLLSSTAVSSTLQASYLTTHPTIISPLDISTYHNNNKNNNDNHQGIDPLDKLATELGMDRRHLHKLGVSSKSRCIPSSPSVHTISVRESLQQEDMDQLRAMQKAIAPKPIHEHISSSTKLNVLQLAKKAISHSSELNAMFAAQKASKAAGARKYGF